MIEENKEKTMLLIDGNSIMNRAFYGILGKNILQTPDGIYTNAIYGFLQIIFKAIDDFKPEDIAVAFDLKGKTKRHEIYEEYKAGRSKMPDELQMQMPLIKEILKAMNILILEKEGIEADDIIGTIAKKETKKHQNKKVIMLTGDRDYYQLIEKNIYLLLPRTSRGTTEYERYTVERIQDEFGIKPEQFIEIKALQGDASDNIPGVPGIGEKTALNLIKEYKTVDEIYDKIAKNEDNLKGKQRERLVENKELAILSRTLRQNRYKCKFRI